MIINKASLDSLFTGFKTSFNQGFEGAETAFEKVAMVVPSQTSKEIYAWLGQFPGVIEWVGPRVVKNLAAHDFTIENKKFENTISVPRTAIEDDQIGVFGPLFTELGKATAEHPDQLIFNLLANGFTAEAYDGQNFFDTDHPVGNGEGPPQLVSNFQGGAGEPWFLLDTSRAIKPLIYQRRIPFQLTTLNQEKDDNVFWNDEYIYGVRGRSNVGFGLWQLAYASKEPLDADNYEAARVAMMNLKGDEGRPLGVKPNMLVCSPALEGDAMRLLNNGTRVLDVGGTPVAVQNEWQGTATPIVTSWLGA